MAELIAHSSEAHPAAGISLNNNNNNNNNNSSTIIVQQDNDNDESDDDDDNDDDEDDNFVTTTTTTTSTTTTRTTMSAPISRTTIAVVPNVATGAARATASTASKKRLPEVDEVGEERIARRKYDAKEMRIAAKSNQLVMHDGCVVHNGK